MDSNWLMGAIETAGCFSVVIRKSPNKIGYQTALDFTLRLPARRRDLLEKMHSTLGIGRVYSAGKSAVLKSTSMDDACRLADFIGSRCFASTSRKEEFMAWKECVSLVRKGEHLTLKGMLRIARIRDSVHEKNPWNKKGYCHLRIDTGTCPLHSSKPAKGCSLCMEVKA